MWYKHIKKQVNIFQVNILRDKKFNFKAKTSKLSITSKFQPIYQAWDTEKYFIMSQHLLVYVPLVLGRCGAEVISNMPSLSEEINAISYITMRDSKIYFFVH